MSALAEQVRRILPVALTGSVGKIVGLTVSVTGFPAPLGAVCAIMRENGAGCLLVTLLVAGTFYVYTVTSILIFIAVIPGLFAVWFAFSSFPAPAILEQPNIAQLFRDLRRPGAILFALLLFFQFGNEWSIAGWLPLFLIRRLGVSPSASLVMLTIYWLALLVGRLAAAGGYGFLIFEF